MDTGGLASLTACGSSTVACSIIVCTYLGGLSRLLVLGFAKESVDTDPPTAEET